MARFLHSRHPLPVGMVQKALSAHRRPRNRVPRHLARKLHRDFAVELRKGSTVAGHLFQVLRKPQQSLAKQRKQHRRPAATNRQSETDIRYLFITN